jgi:hypothetical protein
MDLPSLLSQPKLLVTSVVSTARLSDVCTEIKLHGHINIIAEIHHTYENINDEHIHMHAYMYVPGDGEIAFGVGTVYSLNPLHGFHQIPSYE